MNLVTAKRLRGVDLRTLSECFVGPCDWHLWYYGGEIKGANRENPRCLIMEAFFSGPVMVFG